MIDVKELEKLAKLGLTDSAARIYLLLLQKSNSTASELSKLSGISRSKTYELLNILISKGLCAELLGSVKKYVPVDPKKAFIGVQKQLAQEYEENSRNVLDLVQNLTPLFEAQKGNFDPLDFIQVFRSKASSLEKAESLESLATEEILSLCKPPYAMELERTNSSNRPYMNKLRKDIVYKSIYEIEPDNEELFLKRVKLFHEAGGIARVSPHLPLKLVIFDQKDVIFNLQNQAGNNVNFTTLSIEHKNMGEILNKIFDLYWNESIPFSDYIKK
ncbi:MAG TPA: helix-turn-helix domain-containing protein [Candidatus Cloacimonadota bacterium]|nr:helix-turn-helix domain-containing protein [Candidatus Cloacimonadota bacterium]